MALSVKTTVECKPSTKVLTLSAKTITKRSLLQYVYCIWVCDVSWIYNKVVSIDGVCHEMNFKEKFIVMVLTVYALRVILTL